MKKVLVFGLIALAVVVGCNKSEEGGRGGDDTFRIIVPSMATNIMQGEVQTVRVSVERGEGFQQGISLQVKAPDGLQVEPDSATVKLGDEGDVQLVLKAAEDAPLGDQMIRVHGAPDKGEAVEIEFKVTVSAK